MCCETLAVGTPNKQSQPGNLCQSGERMHVQPQVQASAQNYNLTGGPFRPPCLAQGGMMSDAQTAWAGLGPATPWGLCRGKGECKACSTPDLQRECGIVGAAPGARTVKGAGAAAGTSSVMSRRTPLPSQHTWKQYRPLCPDRWVACQAGWH